MKNDLPDLDWPLMRNNITPSDIQAVTSFLNREPMPILTQSAQVKAFEEEWSDWLGVRRSVFVNSGSSANLVTMAAVKELRGSGEVILPPLTWVSDIAAVLQAGLTPVFVDINPRTLGMNLDQVAEKLTDRTRAVFITHILGYNALTPDFVALLKARNVLLFEDVCESHGATMNGRKLGTFGCASNFSFYYAHHLSTIEGGMICTDDEDFYQTIRMFRSHGLVRELSDPEKKSRFAQEYPDLSPEFIFAYPAYNIRNTEINAVIGRSQLPRLDEGNVLRRRNLELFLSLLDPEKFRTDFELEGSCNYAFTLVLKNPDEQLRDRVESALRQMRVEFRRGTSGGGNQLRQPYLRRLFGESYKDFPEVEHIHFFGYYLGNYPTLEMEKIPLLCQVLNQC